MQTLTTTLREVLAVNAHDDDEGHLRCTCDDCVKEAGEALRTIYKDLSEAAFYLPIPEGEVPLSVSRFKSALHRFHVFVSDAALALKETDK